MKRLVVSIALMCFVTGCETSKSYVGPSGKITHQIKCRDSSADCFKKASTVCKGPYKVLSSSSNAGGAFADLIPGPNTWYRMDYICGEVNTVQPDFKFKGSKWTPPVYTPPVIQQPQEPKTTHCTTFYNSITCREM
jgi:hypothetical protein